MSHTYVRLFFARNGAPGWLSCLFLKLFSGIFHLLFFRGLRARGAPMLRGVTQGNPISAFLFILLIQPLISSLTAKLEKHERCGAFADDVALLLTSIFRLHVFLPYFMAFSFTREDFSQVLIEKADAGLKVRGLYESQQIASGSDQSWNLLTDAEMDVLQDGNRYKLHHKVIIIDSQIIITGSYNFSNSAEDRNDENILIIHDLDLAFLYLEEFAARWLEAGGGTS